MMENVTVSNDNYVLDDFVDDIRSENEKISYGMTNFSPVVNSMIAEGGINFFSYLKNLGLSREPNLMVLSSKHHYYYDETDLKRIKTLVNIKKFNAVRHPHAFLDTLIRILPGDAGFIGCFSDSSSVKGSGVPFFNTSRLMHRFLNIIDSKTDRTLTRDEVTEMLESHGFKVFDMTEMDGITYFHSKPVLKHAVLRA